MKIKIYKKSPSNKTNQNYQFDTDLVLEEPVLEDYQQTGNLISKFRNREETMLEDLFELVDPTGISSHDDVRRAYNYYKKDNSLENLGGLALETLGAVPVFGKFAKIPKAASLGAKALHLIKPSYKGLSGVSDAIGDLYNASSIVTNHSNSSKGYQEGGYTYMQTAGSTEAKDAANWFITQFQNLNAEAKKVKPGSPEEAALRKRINKAKQDFEAFNTKGTIPDIYKKNIKSKNKVVNAANLITKGINLVKSNPIKSAIAGSALLNFLPEDEPSSKVNTGSTRKNTYNVNGVDYELSETSKNKDIINYTDQFGNEWVRDAGGSVQMTKKSNTSPSLTGQPVKEILTAPITSTTTTGKGGPSKDKSVKVSKNEPLDWNADELIKRIQRPGFTDIDKWKKDVNNSSMPLENKLQLLELVNDPVKDSKFALERLPGTEAIERNIPTEINTNLPTAFEKYNKQIQKSGIPRGNNTGNVLKGVGKALSTVNSGNGLFSRLLENARFARAFNDTAPIFRGKANYEYTAQPLIDFQPVADGIRGIFSDMTRNINTNSTTGGSVLSHLQGQATEQMVKAANDVAMKNQQIEAQNRNNALNAASRQFSEQQRLDASAYDQQLQNSAMRDTGINTAINGMIRTQADERERKQMFDTLPLLVPELEEVSTPFDRIMGRRKYGQSRDLQFSYANNRTTQA